MKHILLAAALAATCTVHAQDLPQASPKGEVEQVVGLTKIEVEYNRPSVRGRKIFGELVPYGKVWRTGANLNTTIEFEGPVVFGGQKIEAGKYSLFTIPGTDSWTIILNKNTELWGEGDRKEEEDVLQVKVKPVKSEHTETLTFSFDAVKDDKARLDLRWDDVRVSVDLHADATEQAVKNIGTAVNGEKADFRTFNGSARFLVDRDLQPEAALKYATKSVELDRKFWNLHTLALAQARNGDHKSAIATAEESLKLAQEAENDAYIKMNKDRIAEWTKALGGAATPVKKK